MQKMNENDKNKMLDELLSTNENYHFKIWGTLMAGSETYAAIGALSLITGPIASGLGALSNAYCYIGMTDNNINFVIVDSFNVSNIKNKLSIPISKITNVKIKKSIIIKRRVVTLYFENNKLEIALMDNAIGTDLQNQKEGVETFCKLINKE